MTNNKIYTEGYYDKAGRLLKLLDKHPIKFCEEYSDRKLPFVLRARIVMTHFTGVVVRKVGKLI